jgi:ATP-dependent Clp protease ATP-binding subunit ClpA
VNAFLKKLRSLPEALANDIKGQPQVVDRVSSVLVRGELGMAQPRRPKGSFLFVGPTGVGKTELTNVFTGLLFNGAAPVRFDMSEYQMQRSIDRLLGESAADRGLLGRALTGLARGTLLFDEIEKAHPLIINLLLQILEDARITLATGEILDLRNFYVVCTSNIGSEEAMRMESAPFASVERTVLSRVNQTLRPELVGRFTEKLVFRRLDFSTQREICEAMIAGEVRRLRALGYFLEIEKTAVEFLVRRGYHRTLGARPMRGVVEENLQSAIANALLVGESGSGEVYLDPTTERVVLRRALSQAASGA